MKISAGSLDGFLEGGFEPGVVTMIYGPGGSGKTLMLLMAMKNAPKDKKIIFIDTEGGFSVERLKQICTNHEEILERTISLSPTNFDEQKNTIEQLKELNSEIGLIVVDTLTGLYRIEMSSDDNYGLNKEMARQLRDLVEIARKKKIPIVVTGQVYSSMDKDKINVVGGQIIKNMCKCLIEIQKNDEKRTAIIRKHRSIKEGKEIKFEIVSDGITLH